MRFLTFTLLTLIFTTSAFATQNKKTLEVRLQSPGGNIDAATMYFDEGITPAYSIHEDAQMVFANVPGIPEIYSYTSDNVPCSINGVSDLSTAAIVAVGYHVGVNGLYNISGSLIDNFDPSSVITLEDRQLGVTTDLREDFYQVQLDTTDAGTGRFFIHVSYPVQFASVNSNCSNTGGSITVTTDPSITWDECQLISSNSQVLATETKVGTIVNFPNLSAGSYQVVFTYGQYSATEYFQLSGNFVVAAIGVPGQTIAIDQDVTFNAITTNANQYSWDFGDGTLIDGVAHPDQTYLVPGNYMVNLTCSNSFGCSATAQTSVSVTVASGIGNTSESKDVSIITIGKQVSVNLNDVANDNSELSVTNLLGQSVYVHRFTAQKETINLNSQPSGYYLVSVKNAGKVNTKRVFLAN